MTGFVAIDGVELRMAREARGWSAAQLAQKASISTETVYRLERRGKPTTRRTLARLSMALGIDQKELRAKDPRVEPPRAA